MSTPPRRPWWKRKRWWPVMFAGWLVAYILSLAPAAYVVGRWPATEASLSIAYYPLIRIYKPDFATAFTEFVLWCGIVGQRHRDDRR